MVKEKDSLDIRVKTSLRIGTVYREFCNGKPLNTFVLPISYSYLEVFDCSYNEATDTVLCRGGCVYRCSIYTINKGYTLIPYRNLAPCWKNLYPNDMILRIGNPNKPNKGECFSMLDVLYNYLLSDLQKYNIHIEGIGTIKINSSGGYRFEADVKYRYNTKGYVRIQNFNF